MTLPQLSVNKSHTSCLGGSDMKRTICTLNKTISNSHKHNMSQHDVWKDNRSKSKNFESFLVVY